jgi:hypothetical protein
LVTFDVETAFYLEEGRLTGLVTFDVETAFYLEEREGRIKATRGRGRRRKQLLHDLKENRGYCKLREEALDRTVWRTGFGRGYGPFVRQTTV